LIRFQLVLIIFLRNLVTQKKTNFQGWTKTNQHIGQVSHPVKTTN